MSFIWHPESWRVHAMHASSKMTLMECHRLTRTMYSMSPHDPHNTVLLVFLNLTHIYPMTSITNCTLDLWLPNVTSTAFFLNLTFIVDFPCSFRFNRRLFSSPVRIVTSTADNITLTTYSIKLCRNANRVSMFQYARILWIQFWVLSTLLVTEREASILCNSNIICCLIRILFRYQYFDSCCGRFRDEHY